MSKQLVLGATIGNCVHVSGLIHFLQHASQEGYATKFVGSAVPISHLFEQIKEQRPSMVAVSYRLTPENVQALLQEIVQLNKKLDYSPIWVFGGTKPVAKIAKKLNFFSFISDGCDDVSDTIHFLRNKSVPKSKGQYGTTLSTRIANNYPYPLLRHHFGVPSLEDTIKGIQKIARAKILDVISLGPDQNTQQFFFHPEKRKAEFNGAGGVPIHSKEDFIQLKRASQTGNYPLMRCYSGTEDVFDFSSMLLETIDNAWPAIPLFWYSELDNRGTRPIEQSIVEAQALIKWHGSLGLPVEINDPHQWGLRDAHDVIPVATAYIAAYNAKKLGVKEYISQYMFNTPNGTSFSMDLARVLAMLEMVESLHDDNFTSYRQTRAGLALFSADPAVAQGQLAASTFMQMVLRPHIMHVVGYCEANHAATANEVISSCKIAKGVIRHVLDDQLPCNEFAHIVKRKNELVQEARTLLAHISKQFSHYEDPLTNPVALAESVKRGYLDAAHIMKNNKFRGTLSTRLDNGKFVAQDQDGHPINEKNRLKWLI